MRRALLGLMGAVALGAIGVLLVGFIWPDVDSEVELGRGEAFPPGSVTSFYIPHGAQDFRQLAPGEGVETDCVRDHTARTRPLVGVVIHLVRFEDGSLLALSGRSTHLGEMVPWFPEFFWDGQRGWFREPCRADTYALDGAHVHGPAPRDLDRFALRVEDGRVIVDTNDVTEGERR